MFSRLAAALCTEGGSTQQLIKYLAGQRGLWWCVRYLAEVLACESLMKLGCSLKCLKCIWLLLRSHWSLLWAHKSCQNVCNLDCCSTLPYAISSAGGGHTVTNTSDPPEPDWKTFRLPIGRTSYLYWRIFTLLRLPSCSLGSIPGLVDDALKKLLEVSFSFTTI